MSNDLNSDESRIWPGRPRAVAELELAGNQKLRFYWLAEARSLAIELWKPETRRDGHGLVCQGYRTLRGAELVAGAKCVTSVS